MYVCGVITESPALGAQACAVWVAALLAYAMLVDVPPQVRWPLRLGVGVFTVPMLAAALTALEPSQYGWFATKEYREPTGGGSTASTTRRNAR